MLVVRSTSPAIMAEHNWVGGVAAACIYVPWVRSVRGLRAPLGYDFLWNPPARGDWVVVDTALFAGVLVVLVMGRKRSK
jgi:hypothetical protein